jgi:hypothetical protein
MSRINESMRKNEYRWGPFQWSRWGRDYEIGKVGESHIKLFGGCWAAIEKIVLARWTSVSRFLLLCRQNLQVGYMEREWQ